MSWSGIARIYPSNLPHDDAGLLQIPKITNKWVCCSVGHWPYSQSTWWNPATEATVCRAYWTINRIPVKMLTRSALKKTYDHDADVWAHITRVDQFTKMGFLAFWLRMIEVDVEMQRLLLRSSSESRRTLQLMLPGRVIVYATALEDCRCALAVWSNHHHLIIILAKYLDKQKQARIIDISVFGYTRRANLRLRL